MHSSRRASRCSTALWKASTAGCGTSSKTRRCSATSPVHLRGLGHRLHHRAAPLGRRLPDASRFRLAPDHRNRPSRCARRGFRAPSDCSTRAERRKPATGSGRGWMKGQWQVRSDTLLTSANRHQQGNRLLSARCGPPYFRHFRLRTKFLDSTEIRNLERNGKFVPAQTTQK